MKRISPLGMRVVVRIRDEGDMSDGGLYLPEGAKSAMSESILAEVMEVATASCDRTNEEANISGIPLGATILIAKDIGVKVPWDEKLRIIETRDVLAVVDEIHFS